MSKKKYTLDEQKQINVMIDWINARDVFWLMELQNQFGVTYEPVKSNNYNLYNFLIKKLKELNYIQCCERKKTERQYILVKVIPYYYEKLIQQK
jgi:hypothetical protein